MELLKKETARFQFGEVSIFVRTRASVYDKLAMEAAEKKGVSMLKAGASTAEVLAALGKETIKLFVDGWEGVTLDGKPAPYSFAVFEHGLPAEYADKLLLPLCKFISENVDILKS